MKDKVLALISEVCREIFNGDVVLELDRPDEQFGDFSTNIAMKLAKEVGGSPRDIAQRIAEKLQTSELFAEVGVAGPGFINMTMADQVLVDSLLEAPARSLSGIKVLAEYSCPNYFKELHAGHLYQTIVGDVLSRILENAGADIVRANFGGDVGLHVAKAIYGMNKTVNGMFDTVNYQSTLEFMRTLSIEKQPAFLAESYVLGSSDYESDADGAKRHIEALNKDLYQTVFSENAGQHHDADSQAQREIHKLGKAWSRDYFDSLYEQLDLAKNRDGAFFEYIAESETSERGKTEVSIHTEGFPDLDGHVFVRSDEATVFKGEDYGLHTRVFLTKQGLPTYEAKDLGLIFIEQEKYGFDRRILITGNDQAEYMKVVWQAADLIRPGLKDTMTHLTNGSIRFGDGKKMSSRLGNVTRAVDVLDTVRRLTGGSEDAALGAVKYEFLKHRLGGDIAFDPEESVALEGNSGPYLQYAHARAKSILRKSDSRDPKTEITELGDGERSLVRKLSEYNEAIERATDELAPHHICTYLYELAQTFNRFYENNKVIDDERENVRLSLVGMYADKLREGLGLLGIHSPEQM